MSITLTKFNGLILLLNSGPIYGYEELPNGTRLLMAGYTVDVVETLDEIQSKWDDALKRELDAMWERVRTNWR